MDNTRSRVRSGTYPGTYEALDCAYGLNRFNADVPLQATPAEAPGEGHATEVLLVNTDRQGYRGDLSVMSPRGDLRSMILR